MKTAELSHKDEWYPMPVAQDFESLRDLAETYTTNQILEGLEELSRQRATYLLSCYTEQVVPPEERKQALYDYCAVAMAEEQLVHTTAHQHNPQNFPEWLMLAQARMAEFIIADPNVREILMDTQLFGKDVDFFRSFANSVSASIMPKDAHNESDQVFAVGIITGQVRPWVLPEIRADELTLA
jgi:hypothetical protein